MEFFERLRKVKEGQAPRAVMSEMWPETAFSDRSKEVKEAPHENLEIEPERLELLRERDSKVGRESKKFATVEKSVLRWELERSMEETLEFLQETPWKLQGEMVGCHEGSWVGSEREFLKEISCWESRTTVAEEREKKKKRRKRSNLRRAVEYKGWWKRLLSAFMIIN